MMSQKPVQRIGAKIDANSPAPKTKHFVGRPPELTHGTDTREELPAANVLMIEASESGVLLIRYSKSGRFVGDTWHVDVEDAKEQAKYEFGEFVSPWVVIPLDINDVVEFVLRPK